MDRNWRLSFSQVILERGVRYCRHGLVEPLRQEGGRVLTSVHGSRVYPVELVVKDGAVTGMKCGCPHAAAGHACKHMAAALFALEERGWPAQSAAEPPLAEDGAKGTASGDGNPDQWRRFLDLRVLPLVEQGLLDKAFLLTGTILPDIAEQAAASPNKSFRELERECLSLLMEIAGKSAPRQRMEMYRWLEETRSRQEDGPGAERLLEVQLSAFHEPALLRKNLDLLDRLLAHTPEQDRRRMETYVVRRLGIMRELDAPAETMAAFRRQYRHLPAVREAEVHELLRQKQYGPAIDLLKEGKRLDGEDPEFAADCSSQLIRLYQRLGRWRECREELLFHVFAFPQEEPAHLQALKALTPEDEWPPLRKALLASPTVSGPQKAFLAEGSDGPEPRKTTR